MDEVRFNMKKYGNVAPENATLDDFQKLYWCAPPKGNMSQECGAPPCNSVVNFGDPSLEP